MTTYKCRVCGSSDTSSLGNLKDQVSFAGKNLIVKLPNTILYRCNSCQVLLRHPILSAKEYNQLYTIADSNVWSNNDVTLRRDQIIIRDVILGKFKGTCKVLDVGCYTGDLLASLPSNFLKHGIEISKEAAKVAMIKGVDVVGRDLYDIDKTKKYDLILAVDVIEHTENPEFFLKELALLLDVNGHILVSTGNSDSWLWKHLKNKFWYSRFPEHISFIGDSWLERFCRQNNFSIIEKLFFNYSLVTPYLFLKNTIKLVLSLVRIDSERFSNVTKDHFYFIIKNKY